MTARTYKGQTLPNASPLSYDEAVVWLREHGGVWRRERTDAGTSDVVAEVRGVCRRKRSCGDEREAFTNAVTELRKVLELDTWRPPRPPGVRSAFRVRIPR